MDLTTLTDALASAGITEDAEVFEPLLKSISLSNDGGIEYDFLSKSVYFDTTNELLRIKEYVFKLGSSEFFRAERTSASNYRIYRDNEGRFSARMSILFKKIRDPRVGDIAFTVSASAGSLVASANITDVDLNAGTIETSSDLSLSGNILCYADGTSLEINSGSIVAIEAEETVTTLMGKDAILIVRKPVSSNDFDSIFTFESIESLIFKRYTTTDTLLKRG
jgi:hypothetical protein